MKTGRRKQGTTLILSALIFLLFWLAGSVHAVGSGNRSEEGSLIILQKKDSGRKVDVKSGDVIQIELSGSGGTGYWWYVTTIDKTHAEVLSEETSTDKEKKVGGPVTGNWHIRVRGHGTTKIVMKYYRIWEGPEKAADQFSVDLNIE
jgi:predicted secreted protein